MKKRIACTPKLVQMGKRLDGLSGIASVHIPVQREMASEEIMEQYFHPVRGTGTMKFSGELSNKRKQILADIRKTQERIRAIQEQLDLEDRAEKAITHCLQGMAKRTEIRLKDLVQKRANELRVSEKYIKLNELVKKKSVLLIEEL